MYRHDSIYMLLRHPHLVESDLCDGNPEECRLACSGVVQQQYVYFVGIQASKLLHTSTQLGRTTHRRSENDSLHAYALPAKNDLALTCSVASLSFACARLLSALGSSFPRLFSLHLLHYLLRALLASSTLFPLFDRSAPPFSG